MAGNHTTLHMMCGKIASGKSTLARRLASEPRTVLISEDRWLHILFSDQLKTGADYSRCAPKLRQALGSHISDLLRSGVSVVLDFQANTVEARAWMREVFEAANAMHQLHLLDVPDDICLKRLLERNATGEHAFAVTEEQFHRFARHFMPPTAQEGFNVIQHPTPA